MCRASMLGTGSSWQSLGSVCVPYVIVIQHVTVQWPPSHHVLIPGTWRSHAVAAPSDVHVIPREGLSLAQAATVTVNTCTAYRMLKDFINLKEGEKMASDWNT